MVRRCAPVTMRGILAELARPAVGIVSLVLVVGLGSTVSVSFGSPLLSLATLIALALGCHALFLRLALHMRLRDVLPRRAGTG